MKRSRLSGAFSLIEIMIVVAIIGVLATVAIPNFFEMRGRARQSEAKANLKAIFGVLKLNFADQRRYTCGFCGWAPEKGNVYTYSVTSADVLVGKKGCAAGEVGHTAEQIDPDDDSGTPGSFTAVAAGNIDSDRLCDGWTITDRSPLRNVQDDVINE